LAAANDNDFCGGRGRPSTTLSPPPPRAQNSFFGSSSQAHNNHAGVLEIYMSHCPPVPLPTNLKLLKQFEQTGQVVIPVSEWLRFFEALTTIARDGGHREIYCAFAGEYLVFSRTPLEWRAKKEPTQSELFD